MGRFDRIPRALALAHARRGTATIIEQSDEYAFVHAPYIRAAVRQVGHNYRQVANGRRASGSPPGAMAAGRRKV